MKCTTFLLQLDPTGEESLFPLDNVSNENVMKLPLDISCKLGPHLGHFRKICPGQNPMEDGTG